MSQGTVLWVYQTVRFSSDFVARIVPNSDRPDYAASVFFATIIRCDSKIKPNQFFTVLVHNIKARKKGETKITILTT